MQFEFGIWDHFEHRPGLPVGEQYREKIDLVLEAERLGFDFYHVAEHHLSPLDIAPSPNIFLAALAQATNRIRIGTGVHCLPLYHPVRLVQELCMLDNLSNGRVDVGVGRGIREMEHRWFGIPLEEIRPRFDEVLDIIVNSMSTGNLKHQGRFYQIDDAPLDLPPVQRPYPPLWYAGGLETAASSGFNFLTRNINDVKRYWELWPETKQRPDRLNPHLDAPKVGITRHVVARESYDEAERIARRSWPVFESHWFATPVHVNEEGVVVSAAPGQTFGGQDFDQALGSDRRLLIGTPAMIRERLAQWVDELKAAPNFFFSPAVQWGDITTDEARESITLIARDVMPSFTSEAAPVVS
jgi:alkanesulfonate monooxygenase SsuD/methylene tetrahydromethanopterin reductase-like flavin-dependent oxidoreductase (luciferase family)